MLPLRAPAGQTVLGTLPDCGSAKAQIPAELTPLMGPERLPPPEPSRT